MKRYIALLSILCVCCFSCFALVPLRKTATTVETAALKTSARAETSTTQSSSELSEISDKIDGLLLVSQGTKDELNEQVDGLYKDLQDALAASTRTKFFADLGAAFGVKEKTLTYGVTGDIGLRFGKGLMFKIGAIYMVGNDFQNISWGIENLTMTATVGWEW